MRRGVSRLLIDRKVAIGVAGPRLLVFTALSGLAYRATDPAVRRFLRLRDSSSQVAGLTALKTR